MPNHTRLAGTVAQTLFITLYARANARTIAPKSGFDDELARQLLEVTSPDPTTLLYDSGTTRGTIYRSVVLDDIVKRFAAEQPSGMILTAGVGLCTRHHRLRNAIPTTIDWVGFDVPEVIELRRKLIPDDPTELHAASIAVPGWAAQVQSSKRPALVLSEGVCMYLNDAELAVFFADIRATFGSGTTVALDHMHPKAAFSQRHPIVGVTGSTFASAAVNGAAIADQFEGYELVAEHAVMEPYSLAHRTIGSVFKLLTRGQRLYALSELRVR